MNVLDFSTSNAQVTDEIINVSDANPVTLKHDTFYNKTAKAIVISTAPAGGGTVLVNPLDGSSDYTPGDAYTFPEPYNTTLAGDVGYTTIAITNATYHNTDLYVSYYPIWDLLYAARWNNREIIPSQGNYDISAGDTTFDLTTINSYPVGYTFKITAYDGDGSNTFSFDDNGETINGIPIADYVIEGTGGWIMTKTGDGEFIAVGWLGGDVWDIDGGNHAFGRYRKSLSGILNCMGQDTGTYSSSNVTTVTYTFLTHASTDYIFNTWNDSATDDSVWLRYQTQNKTASGIQVVFADDLRGSRTGTGTFNFLTEGRWTTSQPTT